MKPDSPALIDPSYDKQEEDAIAVISEVMHRVFTASQLHNIDMGILALHLRLQVAGFLHEKNPEVYKNHLGMEQEFIEQSKEGDLQGVTFH